MVISEARTLTPSGVQRSLAPTGSGGNDMQPCGFRRLALIGLAATGLLIAGPAAWAQSGKYKEAPSLAEQVKAGKLPPVDARLPQNPLVVPVVDKAGEYGGVWRRSEERRVGKGWG